MISILLTTYNRLGTLKDSVDSVLKQTYTDYELVVMDDASADGTAEYLQDLASGDPRIKHVRALENIGGKFGDTEIVKRFSQEHCRSDLVLHLNDDDYWIPDDLLARQVQIMEWYPSVVLVHAGVVQKYPHSIPMFRAPNPIMTNHRFADDDSTIFVENVFPNGLIKSRDFLKLFAADPANRNILGGAAMFRLGKFNLTDYVGEGFGWQAGYGMICGAATHGDVWYIDEPCIMNGVDVNCASFRGTQLDHFRQCLCSIDAAFLPVIDETREIRDTMARNIMKAYLTNKLGHKFGSFKYNPLGDISHICEPPISSEEFSAAMAEHGIPLNEGTRTALELSDLGPAEISNAGGLPGILQMCA